MMREIEKYELKIVAIQKIKWPETKSLDLNNNNTIFHKKCDYRRQFSTGFIVHKFLIPAIIKFKIINPRISLLTIKVHWLNITFIRVDAPTKEKSQEEKDKFYDELVNVVVKISNIRKLVILGDLNANIGKERIFKPTIGYHSFHEITNNNSLNLIHFVTSRGLVIKSTMFPNKNIHKEMWKSPHRNYTNQIQKQHYGRQNYARGRL